MSRPTPVYVLITAMAVFPACARLLAKSTEPEKQLAAEKPACKDYPRETRVFSLQDTWTLSTTVSAGDNGELLLLVTARRGEGRVLTWTRFFADADAYAAGVSDFGRQIAEELRAVENP